METDRLPTRVEVASPGRRWVDLHPVVFDGDGDGVQAGPEGTTFHYPAACFVTGSVGDRVVGCPSIDRQIEAHKGYELRDVDQADLALLHAFTEGT